MPPSPTARPNFLFPANAPPSPQTPSTLSASSASSATTISSAISATVSATISATISTSSIVFPTPPTKNPPRTQPQPHRPSSPKANHLPEGANALCSSPSPHDQTTDTDTDSSPRPRAPALFPDEVLNDSDDDGGSWMKEALGKRERDTLAAMRGVGRFKGVEGSRTDEKVVNEPANEYMKEKKKKKKKKNNKAATTSGKARRESCSSSRFERRRCEEGGYEVRRAGLSDMGPVICSAYVPDWRDGVWSKGSGGSRRGGGRGPFEGEDGYRVSRFIEHF